MYDLLVLGWKGASDERSWGYRSNPEPKYGAKELPGFDQHILVYKNVLSSLVASEDTGAQGVSQPVNHIPT